MEESNECLLTIIYFILVYVFLHTLLHYLEILDDDENHEESACLSLAEIAFFKSS